LRYCCGASQGSDSDQSSSSLIGYYFNLAFDKFITCTVILTFSPLQDGLLRVILDGGPSRVFFPGDAKLLEEDLEALKVSYSNHLNIKRKPCLQFATS